MQQQEPTHRTSQACTYFQSHHQSQRAGHPGHVERKITEGTRRASNTPRRCLLPSFNCAILWCRTKT